MTSNMDISSRYVNALRTQVKTVEAPPTEAALKVRQSDFALESTKVHAPDLTSLTLESYKTGRVSPYSGKKRPAEPGFSGRQGKATSYTEIYDPDFARYIHNTTVPERSRRLYDPRLFDPKQGSKDTASPCQLTSGWSVEANRSQCRTQPQSPTRVLPHPGTASQPSRSSVPRRQPGLIEIQRFDPRYPGLLLQPDSRPISQGQLASEVKSIYAGLTMVETKCIHVDRAQMTAEQEPDSSKLVSDHWQALIALYRTLLHEHHDFFLASQHPSASPALRRLAAKYSMPARIWKHGIHPFLELLHHRLPDSIDHTLAFIYLAYQMMAPLYETVPAFENTWIEYSKAADKNPSVGRLCHHLAILARPNALQQLYLYARSLTHVRPFPSARESILTTLDSIQGGTEWWRKVRGEVHRTIERLERELYCIASLQKRVFKLVSVSQKCHKSVIATLLCAVKLPVVSAVSDPDLLQTRAAIFRSDSPYDYMMYGIMLLYLGVMFILRTRTNLYSCSLSLSFALMAGMGLLWVIVNRDEFADGIRKTVFEIWLTTTLHVGAQYCYDNYSPKVHVITFLGLSTIFGLALMRFPSMSPLDAIPPFVAIVALIAWAFHEHGKTASYRQRQRDEEQGGASPPADGRHALDDLTPPEQQSSGVHHDQSDAVVSSAQRARYPTPSHNTLPDPATFSISDDADDLASLRSDPPHVPCGT